MNVLVLGVGISNYPTSSLVGEENQLKYASVSAQQVSGALVENFIGARRILLTNEDGTRHRIRSALESETSTIAPDLLVVYFAGHGRPGELLLRTQDGVDPIGGQDLAELLQLAGAKRVIALIDCCYAETIAREFVDSTHSTLCVASSSRDQLAWEDSNLNSSCFAAAVVSTVSSSDLKLDEASLVGLLNTIVSQTTNNAFALKRGAQQEPVVIGKEDANSVGFSQWQALRRRFLSAALATAVVILISTLAVLFSTYRLGASQEGLIVILRGPVQLSFLLPDSLAVIEVTDLHVNALESTAHRKGIIDQEIWGLISRRDETDRPEWFSILHSLVNASTRQTLNVRAGEKPTLTADFSDPFQLARAVMLSERGRTLDLESGRWQTWLPAPPRRCDGSQVLPASWPDDFINTYNNARGREWLRSIYRNGALVSDWFDADFLQHYATLEQDATSNANWIGPHIGPGEQIVAVARAIRLRLAREGRLDDVDEINSALLELPNDDQVGIEMPTRTAIRAGENYHCAKVADAFSAILAPSPQKALEERLWHSYEAYRVALRVDFEEGPTFFFDPDLPLPALGDKDGLDPFHGILALARRGELSGAELLERTLAEAALAETEDQLWDLLWDADRIEYLLASGPVPPGLIKAARDFRSSIRSRFGDLSSTGVTIRLRIMRAEARQALHMDDKDFAVLKSDLVEIEEVLRANLETIAQIQDGSAALPIDLSQPSLPMLLIWSSASLGGELPQNIADRLNCNKCTDTDWVSEVVTPNPTNDTFDRWDHYGVGTRIVAASRFGLRNDLSENTLKAIENYMLRVQAGSVSQRINAVTNAPIFKVDSIFDQAHVAYLALGRSRYEKFGLSDELTDTVVNQLFESASPETMILERNIAAVWIGAMRPKDQGRYIRLIHDRWDKESSIGKKLLLGSFLEAVTVLNIHETQGATVIQKLLTP